MPLARPSVFKSPVADKMRVDFRKQRPHALRRALREILFEALQPIVQISLSPPPDISSGLGRENFAGAPERKERAARHDAEPFFALDFARFADGGKIIEYGARD